MNLFASILTSIIIVVAVWFAVIYQPAIAYAETITPHTTDVVAEKLDAAESPLVSIPDAASVTQILKDKVVNNAPAVSISGVSQEMLISDIASLWDKFSQHKALHDKLASYPSAIYVLYRNISKDFTRAEISIGYNSPELKGNTTRVFMPKGQYQPIISGSSLTPEQLESAWKKLNFSKSVVAVVERHQLNKNADVTSVSMQVLYK